MNILCDNPSMLKEALGGEYHVEYSPALDIYTPDNQILRTLKGMYFSSKLDLKNEQLLEYIKQVATPANLPVPICHTCYNYDDFDVFCKNFIDNADNEIRVAYDVETTAAPFLSKRYKLAGFSLATCVSDGCYVILDSLDYINPDTDKILDRLAQVIRTHNMLVFNSQHEYIATKRCVNSVDLMNESKHLDDVYSMALLLKTESFKADVFKLKLLSHRLLGIDNWATIIDDYIELVQQIAIEPVLDFKNLTETQKDKVVAYRDMLQQYNYTSNEIIGFIKKIQSSYPEWKEQDTIPYTLIPSRMIAIYGCYDSCYLLALYDYFEDWVKELDAKLSDSLNKPHIHEAYEEVIAGQIMSAILTLNGIFISEQRDNEVKEKSKALADKHYNKLWDIISDSLGKPMLREFTKVKFKDILRKNYILPLKLLDLIPEGFKFVKTTSTFYSFECEIEDLSLICNERDEEDNIVKSYLTIDNTVKVYSKNNKFYCKLLQKHLKPYETLENEQELFEEVLDEFLQDSIKKEGSLAKTVFKPMSGPDEIFDILTKDLMYAHFLDRVALYEYHNLPEKSKSADITKWLEENPIFNFDTDLAKYCAIAGKVKQTVLDYLRKSYSYKDIYENLIKEGIKSFASPIMAYIYTIFTSTGCTVDEPKYSAFNFICQLKICRRYLHVVSTFIKGASGGYSSQMRIATDSVDNEFLSLVDTKVTDDNDDPVYTDGTNNVVFGKWFASTADTGRWKATIHNVPAGAYCKRRFVSRYKGGFILANDMSQAEVRELAAVSHCEKLLETVKDPTVDIHKRTASLAFDVPYDQVTGTQRKQTKEGIFSIVYGRELESLATSLFKGDKVAAQRLMDAIFRVYPEIPEYLSDALADAKKHGYLVTRRGAPIYINPFIGEGTNKGEQGFKRNVQNYAIQGGASAWCTGTLVNVQKLLNKYNLKSKIICYIHDSIEIDVAPEEFDDVFKIMNYAFNGLATKMFGLPTASDTVLGVSMGEELDIKRIEKWHYIIEGNAPDIEDCFSQFKLNYNVDIISDNLGETKYQGDDVSWIFQTRAEAQWYDEKTPRKAEFKLIPKF